MNSAIERSRGTNLNFNLPDAYKQESNLVSALIRKFAGTQANRSFCERGKIQTVLYQGVEYTCEMTDAGRVTKLAIVAVKEFHLYFNQANIQFFPKFDLSVLKALPLLTHLYTIYFI